MILKILKKIKLKNNIPDVDEDSFDSLMGTGNAKLNNPKEDDNTSIKKDDSALNKENEKEDSFDDVTTFYPTVVAKVNPIQNHTNDLSSFSDDDRQPATQTQKKTNDPQISSVKDLFVEKDETSIYNEKPNTSKAIPIEEEDDLFDDF